MKIIPYYRVSTKKQVTSFDVQKELVERFKQQNDAEVLAEYQEVESGRNCARPEFTKVLEHAKYSGATIVVAKMDRLARDVHFTTGLINAKVKFIICDMPTADEAMMMYASMMAQYEVTQIRARTTAALQFKKRNGVKLGSSRPDHWLGREHRRTAGSTKGNRVSAERRSAKSTDRAAYFASIIKPLQEEGLNFDEIAARLNELGFETARNAKFTKSTVSRILQRTA